MSQAAWSSNLKIAGQAGSYQDQKGAVKQKIRHPKKYAPAE